jgi:hypothetical protein
MRGRVEAMSSLLVSEGSEVGRLIIEEFSMRGYGIDDKY